MFARIEEIGESAQAFAFRVFRDLCDGQRVPEDLHDAEDKRLWLVRTALELKSRARPLNDEAFLARNFGRVQTHA